MAILGVRSVIGLGTLGRSSVEQNRRATGRRANRVRWFGKNRIGSWNVTASTEAVQSSVFRRKELKNGQDFDR